jgi:hypothetical protein
MTITDRIELNPEVMLGKPVIRGTRITVELIVRKMGVPPPEKLDFITSPAALNRDVASITPPAITLSAAPVAGPCVVLGSQLAFFADGACPDCTSTPQLVGTPHDAVVFGALIAVFVLFLFLRNVRITLVVALTLPAVLAAVVIVLEAKAWPSGTERISVVPAALLLRSTQPPTVRARSCRPRMPNERALARSSLSRPRPLSLISSDRTPPATDRSIDTCVACACLLTLVSASCAVR